MNTQEIFDKVVNHLLTEKNSSATEDQINRIKESCNCAESCFLAGKDYSELILKCIEYAITGISDNSFACIIDDVGSRENFLEEDYLDFLSYLQTIQDQSIVVNWQEFLTNIATKHNLQFNHNKD